MQYNILPKIVVLTKFKHVTASQVMSSFLYPLYYYHRSGNFTLKIIHVKKFHDVKFLQFIQSTKIF